MIAHQPHLSTSTMLRVFRDAYYNFVILSLRTERLAFIPGSKTLFEYCAACPRPHEPGSLFLAADGIFGLSRYKHASLSIQRRGDSMEDLYFISNAGVGKLANQVDYGEPCSTFEADEASRSGQINKADTGIFGVCCARHHTPFVYVSMTTGERYDYLDNLLKHVFKDFGMDRPAYVFYDIACKYLVNFKVSLLYD